MAHSHLKRLTLFLKECNGKATLVEIERKLGFSAEKSFSLVAESNLTLKRCRYGTDTAIAYIGSEIGARNSVQLYTNVRRVLAGAWARERGMRAAIAIDTSVNGATPSGTWSRPDCVLVSYPARRNDLTQLPLLSTFEIEAAGCFSILSVYEAHAHGRGADYSWVIYVDANKRTDAELERIQWAATCCGVGLIACQNPGAHAKWKVVREAVRRNDNYRDRFIKTAIPREYQRVAGYDLETLMSHKEELSRVRAPRSSTKAVSLAPDSPAAPLHGRAEQGQEH